MGKLDRQRLAVVAIPLITILLIVFSWLNASAREIGEPMAALTPATGSVEFNANLRAAEKPVEMVGQYAWTSINGQIVESTYSMDP